MAKIIEAKAVISAADHTGNVFDKIAAKLKGVEKSAKSLESVKAPKFTGDLYKELGRLKLSEKELQGVRKSYEQFDKVLRSAGPGGGMPRASHYFRAIEEWKGKTVDHWRAVKASVDDAEKAHQRFFRGAGRFALHAAGIGGAAYAAGHAIRSEAQAIAARNRAQVRYEQMGLSESQLGEGNVIADAISSKFPSISRTEVLDYLRTNASRLGSWERSKEVAEPYARALIANKLSGGDEHEMEQIVRALEGMGKANTPEQITAGLNAFARAKAANPDYTGEQFRSDMAAAASSKYGLSKDYLENVFPILASHTSGFGNKLATGMSALVGGRMKKDALKNLAGVGLMEDGRLVDEKGYIANNYEWTQKHVRPLLEQRGVHFGEDMTEEDKGKIVAMTAKWFSAKNAQDLILTNLLDSPLVERARQRKTAGLEKMDDLQRKDAGLAFEGVVNQLKDLGAAAIGTKAALEAMGSISAELAKRTQALREGDWLKLLPEDDQRIVGNAIKAYNMPLDDINEQHRRDNLFQQAQEWNGRLSGMDEDQSSATRTMRMKRFEAEQGYHASKMFSQQDTPLAGYGGEIAPASAAPPVQALEGATVQVTGEGKVEGEAKLSIVVEASSYFKAMVDKLEQAIKLAGQVNFNGPGSTGRSSPDADAPARSFGGVGAAPY